MSANRRLATIAGAIAALLVITAGVALGVRELIHATTTTTVSTACHVGEYTITPDQASVAATMVGVVITRNLPERAAVLVLAAGLQESKLSNLASGDGDRDSVGVLQQRPSQGWGTIEQLSDLHYATGAFLDALVKQSDWQTKTLADAIQTVQISSDGSLYAKHEPEAQALADALSGANPAGISCSFPKPTAVATPQQVADGLSADLPVNPPTVDASQGSVTVPGASWATAGWLVANANRYGIESVSYAQRTWSRTKGWKVDQDASSGAVTAVLHKQ